MIVVDRPKLKFLLAGRVITVDVSREYKKGRIYSVGVSATKKAICRVQVLETHNTGEGWRLSIGQWTQETPVYLSANPAGMRTDYTSNSFRAAKDPDGSPIEAVRGADEAWLAKVAKAAAERDDLMRRQAAHRARIENR